MGRLCESRVARHLHSSSANGGSKAGSVAAGSCTRAASHAQTPVSSHPAPERCRAKPQAAVLTISGPDGSLESERSTTHEKDDPLQRSVARAHRPSAIGTGGAGFGFQVGAEVSEVVLVLNTLAAVDAFAHGANVKLGGDVSVAAGPLGRDAAAAVMPVAAVYTYSRSQGLFAGVSLEGAVIATRPNANAQYYGRSVTPDEILSGSAKPPPGSEMLRVALGGGGASDTGSVRTPALASSPIRVDG
jgi:hypothetical protein